jgi:SAM-dependent methyltransferase
MLLLGCGGLPNLPFDPMRYGAEMNWKTVWASRASVDTSQLHLSDLLAADGFDMLGHVDVAAWGNYVGDIAARLGIASDDSLFDVGCGAGAFLYPFAQTGHPVGGLDFSPVLIDTARRAMPTGDFAVGEAATLPIEPGYDWVCANGVFLYFPDAAYAGSVLQRMAAKALRGLAILDVPDSATRDQAMAARRAAYTGEDYDSHYEGLDHLFLARDWWHVKAEELDLKVEIRDQWLAGYLHAPFRYNVFLHRQP